MMAPSCGVVTNIGREHLEFFGDLAGVAREEGTLAESLPPPELFLSMATTIGPKPWRGALPPGWCAPA